MSRKKIKLSEPLQIRLPLEVKAYIDQISTENMVPVGALVRRYVVDRVKQIQPSIKIAT